MIRKEKRHKCVDKKEVKIAQKFLKKFMDVPTQKSAPVMKLLMLLNTNLINQLATSEISRRIIIDTFMNLLFRFVLIDLNWQHMSAIH